jgi:UDP-glucose 4-epimerase
MNELNLCESRILITGGLGFVGSNLANMLVSAGANITILDNLMEPYGGNINNIKKIRDKIDLINGDVRDRETVRQAVKDKTLIFHLAAQVDQKIAMDSPHVDLSINCIGTLNVLEACRLSNEDSKVIFTSSRVTIGEPKYLPVDEDHSLNPKNIYGLDKLLAEKYCLLYNEVYDLKTSVLKLSNVYGPRAQLKYPHYGTLNLFVGYALTNRIIPLYGDGLQTRDYVFVSDVVNALILAAESKKSVGEIFFVGSGVETSLLDIAKLIISVAKQGEYKFVPFPATLKRTDIRRFSTNYSKISKALGWNPKISLAAGIAETVNFYKENIEDYLSYSL